MKSLICQEKKRLTDALVNTTRELTELHSLEMADLAKGGRAERFDLAIVLARRRRKQANRALFLHALEHGC